MYDTFSKKIYQLSNESPNLSKTTLEVDQTKKKLCLLL